jgi:hypothetical protein
MEAFEIDMENNGKHSLPRFLFAILAIFGLLASGIYIGIMSIQGFSGIHLVASIGFGFLGLLMLWGALSRDNLQ